MLKELLAEFMSVVADWLRNVGFKVQEISLIYCLLFKMTVKFLEIDWRMSEVVLQPVCYVCSGLQCVIIF